jgi:hypothetical protein
VTIASLSSMTRRIMIVAAALVGGTSVAGSFGQVITGLRGRVAEE